VSRPRAAVVVTGSELVHGVIPDANGPFLGRELLALGFELPFMVVVGDRPEELEGALREAVQADLCVVSGGLGPTHDDRTVEVVARVADRDLVVDSVLEQEIEGVSRRIAERFGRPYAEFHVGVRKQATLPSGAVSLGLAGTAPGLVVEVDGTLVVVLPGPPGELRRLWARALETDEVRAVLARTSPPGRRVLRFYGVSESAVARALADAGGEGEGVEVTICARELEIEVDMLVAPGGGGRADELVSALRRELGTSLFSEDRRPVEEHVLELCREDSLLLATAESCTGGLVGARLTSVPGSSDAYVGGIVAYADDVKREQLGVADELLARHGAVSAEVAEAMAEGARSRLDAQVAVAVTGVAGPGGGTPEKPVGLVYLHAAAPGKGRGRMLELPGDREAIRSRATAGALHLVRELLSRRRNGRV
jgi:competence/damage-inducible protein CinA-like protein